MNPYILMIEKLAADHLTQEERLLVAEKLGHNKPAPKEMSKERQAIEYHKQLILNRK